MRRNGDLDREKKHINNHTCVCSKAIVVTIKVNNIPMKYERIS
jgi:hypothetical protein